MGILCNVPLQAAQKGFLLLINIKELKYIVNPIKKYNESIEFRPREFGTHTETV
jgi:hypothetical protein